MAHPAPMKSKKHPSTTVTTTQLNIKHKILKDCHKVYKKESNKITILIVRFTCPYHHYIRSIHQLNKKNDDIKIS
jgi:hypothetical protein